MLTQCSRNGRRGWKWDTLGVCFIGHNAKDRALGVGARNAASLVRKRLAAKTTVTITKTFI